MKKGDFVILALCVALGLLPLLLLIPEKGAGQNAVVKVAGRVVATLPLSADGEYVYDENGENVVIVKDGKVCIARADCPDETCVKMGWVSEVGDTIVCLPHRLVVTVTGGEETSDAVTR